jgi:electron transport complex protein RnfB
MFGNASFYLQVRHDRCLNCNNCSIAMKCPSGAWERVPADQAYKLKHKPAPQNAVAQLRKERPGWMA